MAYDDTPEGRKNLVKVMVDFTRAAQSRAGGVAALQNRMVEVLSEAGWEDIRARHDKIAVRLCTDFFGAVKNQAIWSELVPDIVALTEREAQGFIKIFGWDEVATFLPEQADREAFLEFRAPVLAGLCRR